VALFLAAMLLATDPAAGAAQVEAPATAPVKEKKICKVDPSFTGSRMKKKICMTETEWANKNATTANDLKTVGAR
jgi:hypothetical protein